MNFGFLFYFMGERETSPLDHFFLQIDKKILLYQAHTTTTSELYKKEYNELKSEIQQRYDPEREAAQKRYNEILATGGFEHASDADAYANHESGIEQIDHNFYWEGEELDKRFDEMKDYFHKSALSIFYALLESEMRSLCNVLKTTFNKPLDLKHLNDRDYFATIITYLELVIELPTTSLEPFITRFQDIQFLRNRIMHSGGEIADTDNEKAKSIIAGSNGALEITKISGNRVITIRNIDYIDQYYLLIKKYFHELLWLIDEKSEYQILTARLTFLFSFITDKISVTILKISEKRDLITIEVQSTDDQFQFSVKCNISIEKSNKEHDIKIVNQTDIAAMTELGKQIEMRPENIFKDIMMGFISPGRLWKIKITIY